MLLFLTIAFAGQPTKRPPDLVRGEELYRRHCVQCHGVRNRGDGPATEALVQPVPNLEGKIKAKGSQVEIVLQGLRAMPGFTATFDRPDAVRVLKYQASLGGTKSMPKTPTVEKPKKGAPKKEKGKKPKEPPPTKAKDPPPTKPVVEKQPPLK